MGFFLILIGTSAIAASIGGAAAVFTAPPSIARHLVPMQEPLLNGGSGGPLAGND